MKTKLELIINNNSRRLKKFVVLVCISFTFTFNFLKHCLLNQKKKKMHHNFAYEIYFVAGIEILCCKLNSNGVLIGFEFMLHRYYKN